jgi:hypothetical protein
MKKSTSRRIERQAIRKKAVAKKLLKNFKPSFFLSYD